MLSSGITEIDSQAFLGATISSIIIDSATIANGIEELNLAMGIDKCNVENIYIKTGLDTNDSQYLIDNFTKQAASDKIGYDMYVKNSTES